MDQPKRKRGRPKKTDVVSKTAGNRGKVGRPKGDASIINEYKARMLASPKSNKVLESIFNAALNDDHKNQAAAWKLVMDRMLPLSYFEKDSTGGRQSVSITISGVGQVATSVSGTSEEEATTEQEQEEENTIEGEFTEESG